jgi:hypothetical protein
MKGACNIHGGNKCINILVKKPQGKRTTGKLRHRQKKIKMDLGEARCDCVA